MSSTSPGKPPRTPRLESDPARRTPEDAGVSGLEAHLGYWLRAVSNHVSHAFQTKVERQGVTVAEWVVLRALFEGDGIKPSELAAKIGLTRGAVSKLVDRLAAKELVSVHSDIRDGRAQIVTLRAAGRRLVPKLAALADQNDAEAFGHLDPAQRASLLATLHGLVEHLGLGGAPVD
jgi:DNA-binding MarR family transcriptional regulator